MSTGLLKITTTPAVDEKTGYSHESDVMFCFELPGAPFHMTTSWYRGPPEYVEKCRAKMQAFIDSKIIIKK